MNRILQSTTALMVGLIAIAAMAPGAPPSRGKPKAPAAPPHVKQKADAASALISLGHALFVSNCSPCHGANAEGDDGPNLHHQSLPDPFVATAVKSGFKNQMPPFGSKLKPSEVTALVAYVHSLQ